MHCSAAESEALQDRIVMPADEAHLLKLPLGQPLPRCVELLPACRRLYSQAGRCLSVLVSPPWLSYN